MITARSNQVVYFGLLHKLCSPFIFAGDDFLRNPNAAKSRSSPRKFFCLLCGKGFTRRLHLEHHESVHTGQRPYTCDICGRKFTQKSHMKSHKVTHIKNM